MIGQKKSRTMRTWGGAAVEDAGMIEDIIWDLEDDALNFFGI